VVRCIAEIWNTMLCFVSSFFTDLEILFKSFKWFNSNLINALRPTRPTPKCSFKKQLLAYWGQHLPFSKYLQHQSANFKNFRGIICRILITRLLEGTDRVSSFWEYKRFFGPVDAKNQEPSIADYFWHWNEINSINNYNLLLFFVHFLFYIITQLNTKLT